MIVWLIGLDNNTTHNLRHHNRLNILHPCQYQSTKIINSLLWQVCLSPTLIFLAKIVYIVIFKLQLGQTRSNLTNAIDIIHKLLDSLVTFLEK